LDHSPARGSRGFAAAVHFAAAVSASPAAARSAARARVTSRDLPATTHRDTPAADGDLAGVEEIEIIDPRHPLYGRRFRLVAVTSGARSVRLARVMYRPDIFLLLPTSVTSLHPPATRIVPTKLCLEALEDLVRVAAEREECRSIPAMSGEPCRPSSAGRSRTTSPPCSGR
jgi:hypothetical protein